MRENKQVQICGLRLKGPHALVIPSKDPMRRAMIVELFCGFFCENKFMEKIFTLFFKAMTLTLFLQCDFCPSIFYFKKTILPFIIDYIFFI